MRTARFLRNATIASPAALVADANAAKDTVPASKPLRSFTPLTIHPWQRHCLGPTRADLLPQTLLYHGPQLGPRPLIILDHTTQDTADATDAARKYAPMLSHLAWAYGAVYVPLRVDRTDPTPGVLHQSCQQVCAVLDALDVRWTHLLTYSYGSLVAARMAASSTCPHRVGTFLLLDTPLATPEMLRHAAQRAAIAEAQRDVNVPAAELDFAVASLGGGVGPPAPAAADAGVYAAHLFPPDRLLAEGEARYVPLAHLAEVRHPAQLIQPAKGGIADGGVHRELLAIRRPAVVKGCETHGDLFAEHTAAEVAAVLEAWMARFEPDVYIAKRYEQAAKEMTQLMRTAESTPQESQAETGEQRRKKKEKKKKG